MASNLAAEVGTTRPIIGWRAWKVQWGGLTRDPDGRWRRAADGPRLLSWTNDYEWPPFRALTAAEGARLPECRSKSMYHPRRGQNCSCGVYAFRGKRKLILSLAKEIDHADTLVAFGRVSLWGNWVKGTKGWRAEYAYPYDIKLVSTDDPGLARAVANAYAIDVTYGAWDPDAELASAVHDCDLEGHTFGIEDICSACGLARGQADQDSSLVRAKRLGMKIQPPDFETREEALDWYRATTFEIMQKGIAAGEPDDAQLHVDAISDLMRPILHGKFAPVERAPSPRPVSRGSRILDRGLPPQR